MLLYVSLLYTVVHVSEYLCSCLCVCAGLYQGLLALSRFNVPEKVQVLCLSVYMVQISEHLISQYIWK